MDNLLFKMNLQFFAKESGDGNGEDTDGNAGGTDTSDSGDDGKHDGDTGNDSSVSIEAFADIISEKDKRIEELEGEVAKYKRANAELTVRISAGQKTEKTFEENLLGLVGQPARKE